MSKLKDLNFKDLKIDKNIQRVLDDLGFTKPTEIQEKAIPLLTETDQVNFHGQAQTGTGKTLAFSIPLLQKITINDNSTQALVLAPTRELAVQIYEAIKQVSKYMDLRIEVVYGGAPIETQIRQLKRGVQVIIGTPGRIRDHLRRKTLQLDNLKTLVLDEADIMLDMGFKEEIEDVLNYAPKNLNIWLFSATVKQGIKDLINKYMENTVSVRISQSQVGSQNTKQYYCIVPFKHRLDALVRFIESNPDFYGFVFCQTKLLTSEVAEELLKRGYQAGALHGDMSQAQRNKIIKKFKSKDINILIATDVAARGIDVSDITHVINYSLPEDLESYVHRIGRTGRAGKTGTSISFVTKTQLRLINQIEKKFKVRIEPIDVPSADTIVESRVKKASEYVKEQELGKKLTDNEKKLKQSISDLTTEEQEKLILNLLADKFLKNIDLKDISFSSSSDSRDSRGGSSRGFRGMEPKEVQEISLNIGAKEGVEKSDILKFLTQQTKVNKDQILSIRILQKFTFIKLSADCSPHLFKKLTNQTLLGRKIRVNITCIINK